MIEPLSYLTAFLLGLFGSIHCMGMCGGIVGALSLNTQHKHPMSLHLGYHLGRISTYGIIGALAGLLGLWLSTSHDLVGMILRSLSGVILILMGLYVLGSTQSLLWLEKGGAKLWKHVQPLSKHVLPVRSVKHAIGLGLIWGLLPCGLVYSTLSWALVSADPLHSATLMMAFGLGNMPALLSFAAFTTQLNQFKRHWLVRWLLSGCIIVFGIWTLLAPWLVK